MTKSKQRGPTAEMVRINPRLLVELKKIAAERGMSAKALAEEAIREYFKIRVKAA